MPRKTWNPELQLRANINMRTERIKTRKETLKRLQGLIRTYEEALERAEGQLWQFQGMQQSDIEMLNTDLLTAKEIESIRQDVIRNITDFRPVHLDDVKEN